MCIVIVIFAMCDHNKCRTYHGVHLNDMVVVPSPSSMWDYPFPCPYLDQICAGNVRPVFCAGPDPDEDFFPSKAGSAPSLNPMENTSFDDPKPTCRHTRDTELSEVKVAVPTASVATATPTSAPALPEGIPCGNGGCKASRSRVEPRPESPWHKLKTIFLMSVIIALIIWVIAYTLLAQYKIL